MLDKVGVFVRDRKGRGRKVKIYFSISRKWCEIAGEDPSFIVSSGEWIVKGKKKEFIIFDWMMYEIERLYWTKNDNAGEKKSTQ